MLAYVDRYFVMMLLDLPELSFKSLIIYRFWALKSYITITLSKISLNLSFVPSLKIRTMDGKWMGQIMKSMMVQQLLW